MSQRPAEDVYIVDDEGRRYINTPDRPRGSEYVAEARFTIPRYLIVIEKKNLT